MSKVIGRAAMALLYLLRIDHPSWCGGATMLIMGAGEYDGRV
jgi:hypothetical protein